MNLSLPSKQTEQITDKALEQMMSRIEKVRNKIGYSIPLASDHYGHFDHNNAIRLGRAVEKYRLAWLEDMIPWQFTDQIKMISDAIETPYSTGEDIYLKEEFIKLIDARAVDVVLQKECQTKQMFVFNYIKRHFSIKPIIQ